jgi:hypothetical protein
MTADYNSCGWFNPATGCFRPTIAGYYQVNYQLGTTTSTGSIAPALYCNGAILSAGRAANNVCNGGIGTIAMSQTVYMNGSTDYLQIGGASSSIPATLTGTRFSAALTGAITTLPASYQVSQFPTWTSAGTVQAVGISTLANPQPTVGTTSQNQVRYRQIGPKEWEVQSVLYATANSTSAGNGDYLFTLPAGLQFDVSSPFQQPYTNVPSEALGWTAYALANGWATVSRNGAGAYQQSLILPYDATRYRIILIGPNVLFWSSGYYQLGAGTPSYYKWGFTFTAP